MEESDYPTPKLDALFNRPEVFEMPEPVTGVLERLHKILHPQDHVKWDWEVLHSMEDEVFRMAVKVMLDYPQYREQILLTMSHVVDLHIPRW
jgi:hypothetical protein